MPSVFKAQIGDFGRLRQQGIQEIQELRLGSFFAKYFLEAKTSVGVCVFGFYGVFR